MGCGAAGTRHREARGGAQSTPEGRAGDKGTQREGRWQEGRWQPARALTKRRVDERAAGEGEESEHRPSLGCPP